MEPYENVAKERAHKTMMTKNAPADVTFALMSAEYDTHLLQYSDTSHVSGAAKTQQKLIENKIRKWKAFDLSFFDTYMAVLTSKPALMEAYLADLARGDALKNARGAL